MGGAEVVAESTANALSEHGHDIHVLTLSADNTTYQEHFDGYEIRRVPLSNAYPLQNMNSATSLQRVRWHINDRSNMAMRFVFLSELNKTKPDLVLLHNIAGFSISIYEVLVENSTTFVQVLHDHYFNCLYSTMYRDQRPCKHQCTRCIIFRSGHKKLTRKANGVIGVSQYILNQSKAFGAFEGVPARVIHNIAPAPGRISFPTEEKSEEKAGGCTLGYLGALSDPKGVVDLINAFSVAGGGGDRLKLAGNLVIQEDHFNKLICGDSRIEYLGTVERDSFFSSIDCLVVPSKWGEPFGLVAQEALFRGVAVIASNQGALPEVVGNNRSAYLYDAHDPEGLKNALEQLLPVCDFWQRRRPISSADYRALKIEWGDSYNSFLEMICTPSPQTAI